MPNYTIVVSDDLDTVLVKLAAQRKMTVENFLENTVVIPWLRMAAENEYKRVHQGVEADWIAECKKTDTKMFKASS